MPVIGLETVGVLPGSEEMQEEALAAHLQHVVEAVIGTPQLRPQLIRVRGLGERGPAGGPARPLEEAHALGFGCRKAVGEMVGCERSI